MLRLAVALLLLGTSIAFHDCIQPKGHRMPPPSFGSIPSSTRRDLAAPPAVRRGGATAGKQQGPSAGNSTCSGGLCVGMHAGPHEGGPASYPSGNASVGFTRVSSTMTVPVQPEKIDGITCKDWCSSMQPVLSRLSLSSRFCSYRFILMQPPSLAFSHRLSPASSSVYPIDRPLLTSLPHRPLS